MRRAELEVHYGLQWLRIRGTQVITFSNAGLYLLKVSLYTHLIGTPEILVAT